MLTNKDVVFYKLNKEQIYLFNRTGLYPYPTRCGEFSIETGVFIDSYVMSEEVKQYINKQLGIE